MDHEKLIELVRSYTFLYDLSDRKYSDNQLKDRAWRDIGKQLNVNEQDCKKSWALLRDAFRRAIKKTRELKSGQASMPTRKWKYEDEMSFLLPFFKDRPTICTVQYENNDILDEDSGPVYNPPDEEASLVSPDPLLAIPEVVTDSQPSQTSTSSRKRKKVTSLRVTQKELPTETASTTLMKYIIQNKKKPGNDIDMFFNSISTTVQSFPLKDRAIAKAKVFRLVSEMELEILNRNTYNIETDSRASSETQLTESPISFYGSEQSEQAYNIQLQNVSELQAYPDPHGEIQTYSNI